MLDYKPFEQWAEEGERDTMTLANAKMRQMLDNYQQPPIDPEVAAALEAYVVEKKASMPDAFG